LEKKKQYMRILFLLLFIVQSSLFAHTLSDELRGAQVGDYVVFSEQKHIILFRIASLQDDFIVEEIAIPESSCDPAKINWQEWLSKYAPGNSSRTITYIDKTTGAIKKMYSICEGEWIEQKPLFPFLPALFALPLEKVPNQERKLAGPTPLEGEQDFRKLWNPKAVFEKKVIQNVAWDVFRTRWPKDASELSEKAILLYFPRSSECLSYFPYWIELTDGFGKVKVRVIDSGKTLISPVMNKKPILPN
jgi:hypothetical protein